MVISQSASAACSYVMATSTVIMATTKRRTSANVSTSEFASPCTVQATRLRTAAVDPSARRPLESLITTINAY